MRSRSTALAVCLVLPLLAGCASSAEKRSYEPQSPATYAALDRAPAEVTVATQARRYAASDDREEDASSSAPASSVELSTPASPPPPAPGQQLPQATPPGAAAKPEKAEKADPTAQPAPTRDLVIYTARFTMAVYQVEQGLAAVEKIARDNGGYLGQKKDREITVRIPRGRFETTLAAIDKVGDVLHREVQAQDVTDEHVDLEIRIKNARAMQKRLTELLSRASVKDALEIEKELHRVTEELELLEGRMKVLNDKIALSTITVAFEPRGAAIQTARIRLPFPWLSALNLPSLLSLSEGK